MVTADVLTTLADRGHTIDVVTMQSAGLPKIKKHHNLSIYRVLSFRRNPSNCGYLPTLFFIFSALVRGHQLLRKHSYDSIHGTFIFPSGIVAAPLARLFNIPLVLTAHGSDVPGHNSQLYWIFRPLLVFWKWTVRQATLVTAVSEYLRQAILEQVEVPIEVVPNGLFVSGLPTTTYGKKVIVVGRLQRFKGVQDTIRAWGNITDTNGYELVVIGNGPYLQELKQLSLKKKIPIIFKGRLTRDELLELYQSSSVLVSASYLESFGGVIMEAMACGLAVVATDVGGCREVVGSAGTLIPAHDIAALTQAIESYISNPFHIKNHGKQAKEQIHGRYDIQKVAQSYEKVFGKAAQL